MRKNITAKHRQQIEDWVTPKMPFLQSVGVCRARAGCVWVRACVRGMCTCASACWIVCRKGPHYDVGRPERKFCACSRDLDSPMKLLVLETGFTVEIGERDQVKSNELVCMVRWDLLSVFIFHEVQSGSRCSWYIWFCNNAHALLLISSLY